MGSNGDPGGSRGSLAGRGDDEKSDRPLNPLETKTNRAELRRWRNSESQARRNQLDTAKRIQKWIFTRRDRVPLSYAGGPWAVPLPERLAAPGGMLGTLGRALISLVPPKAPRSRWGVCWGGPFLATGYLCPVFLFPRLCAQGPALLGLTLLFTLTVFLALNLETLQWVKWGVLSPDGVCGEGFFF